MRGSILPVFLYLFFSLTDAIHFCPALATSEMVCRFSSDLYLYSDDINPAYEYEPIGPFTPDIQQYCNYLTIDGLNFDPINMMFYAPTERITEASTLYQTFGKQPIRVLFEFRLSNEQVTNENFYNELRDAMADDRKNDEIIEQCILVARVYKLEGMLIEAFMNVEDNQIYLNFLTKLYEKFTEYQLYLFVRAEWYPESIEGGDLQLFADIQTRCDLLIVETDADRFISNRDVTIPEQSFQSSRCDSSIDRTSMEFITETVLQNGVTADKLSITVTTHCQTYRVLDPQQKSTCVGAQISGYAPGTPMTRSSGFTPFFDVCVAQNEEWSKPEYIVSCTDLSLAARIASYAAEKCLAAVTISYVNYDDGYSQNCGCGFTLPITTVVSNVLHGDMPNSYEDCLNPTKLNILENVCCNRLNNIPLPKSNIPFSPPY